MGRPIGVKNRGFALHSRKKPEMKSLWLFFIFKSAKKIWKPVQFIHKLWQVAQDFIVKIQ
jgi:hypothetical protein